MSFSISFDLKDLSKLDAFLQSRSYVIGCVCAPFLFPFSP